MRVGFSKDGITLNSKKIDPLNPSGKGYGIEIDESIKEVEAFELLDALSKVDVKDENVTKRDKIGVLQEMLSKVL